MLEIKKINEIKTFVKENGVVFGSGITISSIARKFSVSEDIVEYIIEQLADDCDLSTMNDAL